MKDKKEIWKILKDYMIKFRGFLASCFKFTLSFFMVSLFLAYVVVGVGSLSGIVDREINRTKNIDEFASFVDEKIKLNRAVEIEDWLRYRRADDAKRIAEVVEARASDLSPNIFFRLASMMFEQNKTEEALFWFNLGKYRLRYDMLRCGGNKAIDNIEKFITILFDLRIDEIYKNNEGLLEKSLKRVVDFDKNHPPMNDISDMCRLVEGLEKEKLTQRPEEDWPGIREDLINSAQEFLKENKTNSLSGKAFKDSAKDH